MTLPTPSNLGSAPFKGHPQKFPRAQRKAAQVASRVHEIIRKAPRTLIATVADAAYHISMGYVTATTEQGVVSVYGVPYGLVVPGMRLYVRQQGPQGTNRAFVFDGFAPALSIRGLSSGSLVYAQPSSSATIAAQALTNLGGMPTTTSLPSGPVGYYWHCYFYLPQLPTARVTLFQMTSNGGTNFLTCEYLPGGLMLFRSVEDNHGYITTAPIEPHNAHWMLLQPGQGGGLDWLIDGVTAPYTGIGFPADLPTFTSNGTTYTGAFLSNVDGSGLCPLGAWISKFGFGTSYTSVGATILPLSVGTTPPDDDSDLPNLNVGPTQQTATLLLCTDTPGGTTLANSATGSSGSGVTLVTPTFQLIAPGPY